MSHLPVIVVLEHDPLRKEQMRQLLAVAQLSTDVLFFDDRDEMCQWLNDHGTRVTAMSLDCDVNAGMDLIDHLAKLPETFPVIFHSHQAGETPELHMTLTLAGWKEVSLAPYVDGESWLESLCDIAGESITRHEICAEEELLINELLADPFSDTTRQIYADWLEERGDKRGGFLRAELSFANATNMADAKQGVDFFNTAAIWNVDEEWLERIGMQFDLRLTRTAGYESLLISWIRNELGDTIPGLDLSGYQGQFWRLPSDFRVPLKKHLLAILNDYATVTEQLNALVYGTRKYPEIRIIRSES